MTEQVFVYTSDDRYERWKQEADERNQSLSHFVQDMVEAGLKNFTSPESQAELERLKEERERFCFDPRELDRLIREYRTCDSHAKRDELAEEIKDATYRNRATALNGKRVSEMEDEELLRAYLEAGEDEYFRELASLRDELDTRGISFDHDPDYLRSMLEQEGIDYFQ